MSLAMSAVATMLPVTDTGRAKEFYSDRLGLPFQGTNAEGSLTYELSGGTVLMLLPREGGSRNPSTALTWEVPDVAAEVAEFAGERAAWFVDPDGNVLCIHEAHRT